MATSEREVLYTGFLVEREKTVSGFNNNCGLNCILGHILDMVRENPDDPIFQEKPYQDLLKHLNDSLKLTGEERLQDYHDVKFLFEKFQSYKDIEKIFASAMRESLTDAWGFYYQQGAEDVKKDIMLKVQKIMEGLNVDGSLDDYLHEELRDVLVGNWDLFRAYREKSSSIKGIVLLRKAERIGEDGYSLEDYKKELIQMVSKALPDKNEAVIKAARAVNIDYDELLFKACKGSNREPMTWIIYLKRKYGIDADGKLNLTQEAVKKVKGFLHKVVHEKLAITFERKELFDLLGARIDGNKVEFSKDGIDSVEFSGARPEGYVLAPDIDFHEDWDKPVAQIKRELSRLQGAIGDNVESLELLDEYADLQAFATDYITGNKAQQLELYKLAIKCEEEGGEDNFCNLKEAIKEYKKFMRDIGYTEGTGDLEAKLLSPDDEDLREFKDIIAKRERYLEVEDKVSAMIVPKWLERAKVSDTQVSASGVVALSSYLGINVDIYSSSLLDLAANLEGVTKIEYQKGVSTSGKPIVRLEEGKGVLIDGATKEISLVFKDKEHFRNKSFKPGEAISIMGVSCPVKNIAEENGKVVVSFDYGPLGDVNPAQIKDFICKQTALTPILLRTQTIKPSLNLAEHSKARHLKVFNPSNVHWQRELAKGDVDLYEQRDRASGRVFIGRSHLKRSSAVATSEDDFYTDEEERRISLAEYAARSRNPTAVSRLHRATAKELLSVAASSAAKEWRAILPGLKEDRRRRLGTVAQSTPAEVVRPTRAEGEQGTGERAVVREPAREREEVGRKRKAHEHHSVPVTRRRRGVEEEQASTDKPRRQEDSLTGERKRKAQYHLSMPPAKRWEEEGDVFDRKSRTMTYTRDTQGRREHGVHSGDTLVDDSAHVRELVVRDVDNNELKEIFRSLSKDISNASDNVDIGSNKLTKTHPKYEDFYNESGDVKDDSDVVLLDMEIARTKAFIGKEVKVHQDDSGNISNYTVTDKASGENIVDSVVKESNLVIKGANRDEETIHLMLAPAIEIMKAKGEKALKIDVKDHKNPEFALKIFETAIKQGLHPRIKEQATLDAIKASTELQARFDKLKSSLPDEPEHRHALTR